MSRKIDHDEEDRDLSEYEVCDEEEEEEEHEDYEKTPEQFITQIFATEHGQVQEHQEPTSSGHVAMEEVPVSMNFEYEEVYPQQVVDQTEIGDAGKVYYENEMEDLVYHEIYGEGSDQQKLGHDKRIRNLLGTSVSCLICQRTESEKIRLFKWPNLREQWLHFFRIPPNKLNAIPDPYICCYHFSADTFVMMDDRIFWKMTALPKYRQRRPGLSEPFPWESAAKLKMDQQILNAQASNSETMGDKIRYRMPYNKHKTRFTSTGMKRRSILGTSFRVSTTIYDYKSSWRPIPGQNGERLFLDDVVYVDENGNSLEWNTVTNLDWNDRRNRLFF